MGQFTGGSDGSRVTLSAVLCRRSYILVNCSSNCSSIFFLIYFIFYCVLVRVTVYVGCLSGVINDDDDDDSYKRIGPLFLVNQKPRKG